MTTLESYRNLLEPAALAELFLRHPPEGFPAALSADGLPLFCIDFDLLTTLEPDARARLERLPLYRQWSQRLRFPTCFVGTTVTEYAPLPRGIDAATMIDDLQNGPARRQSLTILKDLPSASPLLSDDDNAFADALARAARAQGFLEVEGQALAYVPIDFTDSDDYLSRLSAARRKDLRRKMKKRAGLEIDILPLGHACFLQRDLLAEMYAMYREVFDQSQIHFDLLVPLFFEMLLQSRTMEGIVVMYRSEGQLAGYNVCLVHEGRLIDKYIGFRYPLARTLNLYFISWMVNLEFARANGLHTYIAGWTDPEVKASLGARFTFTRHLVRIRNPLLRTVLRPMQRFFESDARTLEVLHDARRS